VNGGVAITNTPAPPAPTGLTGTSTTTQVNLSWTSGGGSTAGFNVYRSGTLIGTATSPQYQDTNLKPGTTYSYTVSARDAGGNISAISNALSIATPAGAPPVTSTPRAVSINFVGSGTAMGASESAGVVAKTNWNNATNNASTTALALVDETGAANGASVTWTADNNWSLPIADSPGNVRMMRGYLDTINQNPTTVNISGLPASSTGYDIYIYTDGDNGTATVTATYQLSGSGITTARVTATDAANTDFSGTFTQAGNYVKFGAIQATAFTITAIPTTASDGYLRAPLNGIQIVPSPAVNSYTISGQVTLSGAGLSGVTVTLNTGPKATTDSSGNYAFSNLPAGTYTGTPSLSGYTFTPPSSTFTNITANQTASFTAAVLTSTPRAVSINFVGSGTAMGASESAGVVAKTNWNNAANNASAKALALVDETGAANGASVTWTADNNWSLPIPDSPGNVRMMRGYLDTINQNPTTVNISGLPASSTGYDIYVYTDGDNPTATVTATYQLSGSGITTASVTATDAANTNFSGTFTQAGNSAGNYVKFGAIQATAFTITAIPTTASDGHLRAPLNGIQIVPSTVVNTYTISGQITLSGAGLSGVTVTLSTGPKATTNSSGNYSFSNLPAGTYTVTPSLSGYMFTTSSSTFTNITANQTANFTAVTSTLRAVSINFVGSGTAMGASESAGVVAKTNWNNAANNASATALPLVDETGAANGSSMTWTADSTWSLPITDSPGNVRMMRGYLDNINRNPTTVNISGLPASSTGYDIYVYMDGDNSTAKAATYQLSGSGITTASVTVTDAANTNFSGTFTQANNSAGNYVKFTAINATAFTITATPKTASNGNLRAPVNGIQVVPH
jgi:hypothetical protein